MDGNARNASLDLARGIAILLATVSHGLVQFSAWEPFLPWLRLATRLATPTFLILFGIMLHIVYVARWDRYGVGGVSGRLFHRGLTCYAIYALATLAALLTGKIAVDEALRAMLYLDDGRFAEILKIYAVLLFLTVPVLLLYRRHGAAFVFALVLTCWTVSCLLRVTPLLSERDVFAFWLGSAPGFGPAMLLTPTFVGFGMLVGRWLADPRRWAAPAIMLVASAAVLGAFFATGSPAELIRGLTSYELRGTNHPAYYAYGILGAATLILAAALIVRTIGEGRLPPVLMSAGRNAIFAYGFGNILLNLLPRYEGPRPFLGAALAALFVMLLLLINHVVTTRRASSRLAPLRLLDHLAERWHRLGDRMAAPMASWVARRVEG